MTVLSKAVEWVSSLMVDIAGGGCKVQLKEFSGKDKTFGVVGRCYLGGCKAEGGKQVWFT